MKWDLTNNVDLDYWKVFVFSKGLLVQVESSCDFEYDCCLKKIDFMYFFMMMMMGLHWKKKKEKKEKED